jgi:hypothetical protein
LKSIAKNFELMNIRTACSKLMLIPIDWNEKLISGGKPSSVTPSEDFGVEVSGSCDGWSLEYHKAHIKSSEYQSLIKTTFDSKLYLGDTVHSAAYRRLFHRRNTFIDIYLKSQSDGCESSDMDVVDGDDHNTVTRNLNDIYEARAYHIILEKVRWRRPDGTWANYSDLTDGVVEVNKQSETSEVQQVINNVFQCVPFIPIIEEHALLIVMGNDKKLPKYCIAAAIDFGMYSDVPDVYNLFPNDEYVWEEGVRKRFLTLTTDLSVLEKAAIAPVCVYGNIAKIVAGKGYDLNHQNVSVLSGHMIAVDNAIGTEKYISNGLGSVIDKEMVKNSLKVCELIVFVCS